MSTAAATGPAPGSASNRPTSDATESARRTTRQSFRVAAVFSDGMVLQRDRPVVVFGTGIPDTGITVSIDGKRAETTIGADGAWAVTLPAMPAGGPHTLQVADGEERIAYRDVLVGEVWLASGQSNMELELRNSLRPADAIAGSRDPLLRFYNTPKTGELDAAAENVSCWRSAAPDTVGTVSAVAYYAARRLRDELGDVPVGVIDCYVGGTSVTCWMSGENLSRSEAGRGYLDRYHAQIAGKSDTECRAMFADWQARSDAWNAAVASARAADPDITQAAIDKRLGPCPWPPPMTPFSQFRPTGPFTAMLRRVAPFVVRGCLWYQGEEDEAYCDDYRHLLGDMIAEWRRLWSDGALPFLIVQLPRWSDRAADESGVPPNHWPQIRAAQRNAADTIPDVYLVPIIDCGEYDNIHPLDKRTVGERLAAVALRRVYGREGMATDGPVLDSVEPREDGSLVIRLSHAEGLHFGHYNGDELGTDIAAPLGEPTGDPLYRNADGSGFELSCGDGRWTPAAARIDGSQVQVDASGVPAPKLVRYAWKPWGPAPLFNDVAGVRLPAEPFCRPVDARDAVHEGL